MSNNIVHIGVSLRIIDKNNVRENATKPEFNKGFKGDIKSFFTDLLVLTSLSAQHWIILTDKRSVEEVNFILRNIITKHLTSNVISTYPGRRKVRPVSKIIIDYVDIDVVANGDKETKFIKTLQTFCLPNLDEKNGKYLDKLFYLGPLYHWIFPNLKKLIFMDVDLSVQTSLKLLHSQFSQFSWDNVLGVGHDLSPHYRQNLEQFRRWHPETKLGDPGPSQGFNTGVVLFDLERMRQSAEYNGFLEAEEVARVMNKYGYHVSLGDQDWFTNIGFESPDLFYRLPCQFNAQISVQYWRPPWEDVFEEYHNCDKPFHIIHKNGCGPTRDICEETLRKAGMT